MSTPSFVAPPSTGAPRKTLEPGTYLARCYQMITLGTHEEEYDGVKKKAVKIWLGWEFPTELDVFSEDKGQEPYTMGKEFSFSMHENSTFRKTLESWRGKRFTDEEAAKFDCGKLLGAPCIINVVAYTKRNGDNSVKIGNISPIMKGTTVDPAINAIQALSLADFDYSLFNSLPNFLQDKIKLSPEYAALSQPTSVGDFSQEPVRVDEALPF